MHSYHPHGDRFGTTHHLPFVQQSHFWEFNLEISLQQYEKSYTSGYPSFVHIGKVVQAIEMPMNTGVIGLSVEAIPIFWVVLYNIKKIGT